MNDQSKSKNRRRRRPHRPDGKGGGKPQHQRGGKGGGQDQRRGRGGSGGGGQMLQAKGYWLHGLHAIAEALLNPKRRIYSLNTTQSGLELLQPHLDAAVAAKMGRPTPTLMSPPDFNAKITDAPGHNGIAADVAPLDQPDLPSLIDKLPDGAGAALVILDQVTDPHNIGAIIRSAAAFGAVAVIGQDRHAPDETAIMVKTASGGMEHVPYVKVTNIARTLTWLDEHEFLSVGLDERGETTLAKVEMQPRIAFVMGAEGSGLRRLVSERCQKLVRLPTQPPIASLNVSNAVAASLYEWRRLDEPGA
ncbi:MAG: 23S rRNA (guanosine(2251)-2'-O)-methyltransferase RlmB [Alphaproteobacteria bacterium]|nr:23S rRNA (guanosine(2251)-2'-O)-methyltransferase RlmB [Alphaproteobacteria bacterium SS10]